MKNVCDDIILDCEIKVSQTYEKISVEVSMQVGNYIHIYMNDIFDSFNQIRNITLYEKRK